MSLLADLLSKIQQPQTKREIPPNLRNIVQDASKQSAQKKKIVILTSLFLTSIAAGLLIVYVTGSLTRTSGQGADVGEQESYSQDKTEMNVTRSIQKRTTLAPAQAALKNVKEREHKKRPAVTPPKPKDDIVRATAPPAVSDASLSGKTPAAAAGKIPVQNNDGALLPAVTDEAAARKDAFLYMAREHELKKEYSRALAAYGKVLELDSDNVPVLNNIAYLHMQLGHPEKSIAFSGRALDIDDGYVPALINAGIAHAKLDDYASAKDYLLRALDLEPGNQTALGNLAIIHERQGNYSSASEYYKKLAKLDMAAGFLGLARIYEHRNRYEEALQLYNRVYTLDSVDTKQAAAIRQRMLILINSTRAPGQENSVR